MIGRVFKDRRDFCGVCEAKCSFLTFIKRWMHKMGYMYCFLPRKDWLDQQPPIGGVGMNG
jgi:hypothetical protein